MDKMPFQIKKHAGYGTAHPVLARIFLQTAELLGATDLPEDLRDKVRQHLFRAQEELIRAEREKDAFLKKAHEFMQAVAAGSGIRAQRHALEIDEPEGLSDHYQLFLVHLAIALRMAVQAASIILTSAPAKWPTLKKHVRENFPADHPLNQVLARHEDWSSDLFEARGEIEHDPFLWRGFTVQQASSGILQLLPPMMPSGLSAMDGMRQYYESGFAFAEDLLARAIEARLPQPFHLMEIPEQDRDPGKPIRFVLGARPGTFPNP